MGKKGFFERKAKVFTLCFVSHKKKNPARQIHILFNKFQRPKLVILLIENDAIFQGLVIFGIISHIYPREWALCSLLWCVCQEVYIATPSLKKARKKWAGKFAISLGRVKEVEGLVFYSYLLHSISLFHSL